MKKSTQPLEYIRHSLAHLLAAAVQKLYPKTQFGIGPTIENGFYYDFENVKISDSDLPRIEKEIREIAGRNLPFKKELWPEKKARAYFQTKNQPYKIELIDELAGGKKKLQTKVGMVSTGDAFLDLCRGGHVKNTKELPLDGFKLLKVAGAYWRGDEKRPMLTRVYGAAFATKDELDAYLAQQEEAEKRDHKKLGKQLGLFLHSDLVGSGLPLFTPKGTTLRNVLTGFVENLRRSRGYQEVWIPHLAKPELYQISGHLEKFKNDLFYVRGKENELVLKPMNCPHHIQIFKADMHSYKDLPVRYFQTTTVYRDEQAGELGGLTRVRSITQDDGHVFLREDQIANEFEASLGIQQELARAVHLKDYWIRLSLRDEKNKKAYLGDSATWEKAQKEMEKLLKTHKITYVKAAGEAAFYGPKMDFMAKDSIGREWQFSTIQLDFNLPKRFNLEYIAEDGTKKMPVMIHSAFLGSVERFIGMLIEHFAGAFPLWLAPEQVWILPVSSDANEYAKTVASQLTNAYAGLRVAIRDENETLGKKIREGEIQKIPYLLIVGEKERQTNTVSVRARSQGNLGASGVQDFAQKIAKEIQDKA